MSKRLDQMRRKPQSDWTIGDVVALCREFDISCEPPRGGGSHYKIYHATMSEILTVPFKRPIKAVYIRRLVAFATEVGRRNGKP
jgi:hypothetical protein